MNWKTYVYEHPQMGPLYQKTTRYPNWVVKGALAAAALVVLVPLVLITISALVVGLFVFAILGLASQISDMLGGNKSDASQQPGRPLSQSQSQPHRSAAPPADGRENVRVIQR